MAELVTNRKVFFNYEVLERYETGIELLGWEVTALRRGRTSLEGSHVSIRGGEAFLIGSSITPLQPKNVSAGHEEKRNRKLLLTKKEIHDLAKSEAEKGLTIVPISMYSKSRKIKVEIAVVKGKKQFDKRETLKKRDTERDIQRTLKGEA